MKFENTTVMGLENALIGMRLPMSKNFEEAKGKCNFSLTDNENPYVAEYDNGNSIQSFVIDNDTMRVAKNLVRAGSEHRKFLRQIFVSVSITAPMYFFSELDTYKVGTVANSTSKMHKLASTPITMDCFEMCDFDNHIQVKYLTDKGIQHKNIYDVWAETIRNCESLRQLYNETKDKKYWKALLRLLPNSWLQTRTITMNYENVLNMYHQRKNHKLTEWSVDFVNWCKTLPFAKELLLIEE